MFRFVFTVVIFFSYFQVAAEEVVVRESKNFEIEGGKIFTIQSKILGRKYDIYIKTPSGYSERKNTGKIYPVLYLNDGPYTFKVAAGIAHLKSMDKSIMVGIAFAHGENGQFSRVRDLTPVLDPRWKRYKTGGAPEYLRFIEDEVIPFVEENYRASSSRRILVGQSLGGSFGAWVLLTKPELFSSYILTSPSLWYKNEIIFDLEEAYSRTHTSLNANVYLATGALETTENDRVRNDMVSGHRKFVARLRSRKLQDFHLEDEIVSGADHYSTFPVGLAKGLRWIYQDRWGML
ncbi:alpha/beta hydrolase-fold protein [uncultured Microbulbifer sp.]|uniref:alpha/beta hydrolase n=1 Tax=uncultured Microbulbifer sp. TaxID=348147 RepID=UPI0026170F90|nr:alpha/beta hydrolase-fold protein [uncultured Microbulbifer sp.]